MNKIEEIEDLLKTWEAARGGYAKGGAAHNRMKHKVEALETALVILKRPSNTQVHTVAFQCKNCGFNDGVPVLQCPECNDTVERR